MIVSHIIQNKEFVENIFLHFLPICHVISNLKSIFTYYPKKVKLNTSGGNARSETLHEEI